MSARFEVLITQRAERDIHEIWEYIALDHEEAADQFIEELLVQVDKLEICPEALSLIDENEALGVDGYRHLIYKKYRTIFRIQENSVIIVRVIHGAKLLAL